MLVTTVELLVTAAVTHYLLAYVKSVEHVTEWLKGTDSVESRDEVVKRVCRAALQ